VFFFFLYHFVSDKLFSNCARYVLTRRKLSMCSGGFICTKSPYVCRRGERVRLGRSPVRFSFKCHPEQVIYAHYSASVSRHCYFVHVSWEVNRYAVRRTVPVFLLVSWFRG